MKKESSPCSLRPRGLLRVYMDFMHIKTEKIVFWYIFLEKLLSFSGTEKPLPVIHFPSLLCVFHVYVKCMCVYVCLSKSALLTTLNYETIDNTAAG